MADDRFGFKKVFISRGLQPPRQPGYDHSYYFVASFMEDHLRWHAERLG